MRQRGLSLVELLIGIAIALLIAAAAATLFVAQVRESRALVLEARLMQDLRTAADLIARDLRRAGGWGAAVDGVWTAGAAGASTNPYLMVSPTTSASDAVSFRYSRDEGENQVVDTNEQFGFRLRNAAVEIELGAGNWQALTDSGTLQVTAFVVTPLVQTLDLAGFCATSCPAGSTACPPRLQVRSLAVEIEARMVADTRLVRRLRHEVRLRNDAVTGACAS
jgi:type IV pilus assembly protein PilW